LSRSGLTTRSSKGALVSFDMSNPVPRVILFQYNPDTMSRYLQGQGGGGDKGGSQMEALRLRGPPNETISLDIELDATDKLEHPDQNKVTAESGLYPELSALELLLYPKSQDMISASKAASSGILEIIPAESLFTLFVWGPKKVLPVHITKLDITEEAFDANLNPVRAKISLGLRVLTYSDLTADHPGYSLFFAHQIAKESLAAHGITNDLSTISTRMESLFR
jgi:hypothetical protein